LVHNALLTHQAAESPKNDSKQDAQNEDVMDEQATRLTLRMTIATLRRTARILQPQIDAPLDTVPSFMQTQYDAILWLIHAAEQHMHACGGDPATVTDADLPPDFEPISWGKITQSGGMNFGNATIGTMGDIHYYESSWTPNWQHTFERGKYEIKKMAIAVEDINVTNHDIIKYLSDMNKELDQLIDQIKIDKKSTILYLHNVIFAKAKQRFDHYSASLARENRQNREALREANRCFGGYMIYEKTKIPIYITEVHSFTDKLDRIAKNAALLSSSLSSIYIGIKESNIEAITTPKFNQSINSCADNLNEMKKFADDLSNFASKLSQIIKQHNGL